MSGIIKEKLKKFKGIFVLRPVFYGLLFLIFVVVGFITIINTNLLFTLTADLSGSNDLSSNDVFPVSVSCSASPASAVTGQTVTFTAVPSGGTGVYSYSWSNSCAGTSASCAASFSSAGTKTATVTVTSGTSNASANCSANITENGSTSSGNGSTSSGNGSTSSGNGSTSSGNGSTSSGNCGECEPIPTPILGIIVPPVVPPAIKKVIETPVGSATTKIITTTGLATAVAATAFAFPFSFLELFLLPLRLIGILLVAFGLKKRNPPWGVVYDSVTKQPLDPAYVALFDSSGKEVSSAITDLDGRYGFLAEPGFYKLSANKTNYLFPSQKLAGKTNDELYDNLYFGEQTEVKKDQIIIKNIPLDPLKFDWNEFIKQDKRLTMFYSKWDAFFRKISDVVYYIGFAVAVIVYFAAPYPYNLIVLSLYIFLFVLRVLGLKPRALGIVIDKASKIPMAFAILRVFDSFSNIEIGHRITDRYGRYFCLVPKGKYYVKIEKKNNDGSYSLVYVSDVIDGSNSGIIKEKFKIFAEAIPESLIAPKKFSNRQYGQ